MDGVLLTHAHIGHYTELMHLGREVLGSRAIGVFAMPRMKYFLETNGPWSQLVELEQIDVRRIASGAAVKLNERITATPFPRSASGTSSPRPSASRSLATANRWLTCPTSISGKGGKCQSNR